jgi:hypothetical protein
MTAQPQSTIGTSLPPGYCEEEVTNMSIPKPVDIDDFLHRNDIPEKAKWRVFGILLLGEAADSDTALAEIYRQAQAQALIELAKAGGERSSDATGWNSVRTKRISNRSFWCCEGENTKERII